LRIEINRRLCVCDVSASASSSAGADGLWWSAGTDMVWIQDVADRIYSIAGQRLSRVQYPVAGCNVSRAGGMKLMVEDRGDVGLKVLQD